jgi:hypothetical protein
MRIRIVRLDRDRLRETGNRLRLAIEPVQRDAQIVLRLRQVRPNCSESFIVRESLFRALAFHQRVAESIMRLSVVRIDGDRSPTMRDRLLVSLKRLERRNYGSAWRRLTSRTFSSSTID